MRFHIGALPTSPGFTPDSSWQPLAEPAPGSSTPWSAASLATSSFRSRPRPGIRESRLGLFLGGMSPDSEAVVAAFINAANDVPGHVVFVIDDYHLIEDPSVHQALTFLLDHQPPTLHFVLAGRAEPPSTMRLGIPTAAMGAGRKREHATSTCSTWSGRLRFVFARRMCLAPWPTSSCSIRRVGIDYAILRLSIRSNHERSTARGKKMCLDTTSS
jgi:hypothetical protein